MSIHSPSVPHPPSHPHERKMQEDALKLSLEHFSISSSSEAVRCAHREWITERWSETESTSKPNLTAKMYYVTFNTHIASLRIPPSSLTARLLGIRSLFSCQQLQVTADLDNFLVWYKYGCYSHHKLLPLSLTQSQFNQVHKFTNIFIACEISGSNSGEYEDGCLLRCCAM
jgi:hypothetical protein